MKIINKEAFDIFETIENINKFYLSNLNPIYHDRVKKTPLANLLKRRPNDDDRK